MNRRYAEGTTVPIEKTRLELEALLASRKAKATAVFKSESESVVVFEMQDRRVMFRIKMPDPKAKDITHAKRQGFLRPLSNTQVANRYDKVCRQKWRALFIAIKSKLVAVEEGIETFEEAFMAHVVMPDGQTVADHVRPRIASAYSEGKMVPRLPAPPGNPP